MTNKFNVGDKVEVLNVEEICLGHEIKIANGYATVESVDQFGRPYLTCKTGLPLIIGKKELPFIRKVDENEALENQRISKLEEEVAELKLIVEQIRKPSPLVSAASIIALGADEPKTANQLRAEIIEKAKRFIGESKVELTLNRGRGYVIHPGWICDLKFEVNEEKRTAVAILSWKPNHYKKSDVKARGIAKCDPSDVFNEHIGKAIALGRALGLDVSEFEQAVQPSLAVGQECVIKNWEGHNGKTLNITKVFDNGKKANHNYKYGYLEDCHLTIINDTNAIYETAVGE